MVEGRGMMFDGRNSGIKSTNELTFGEHTIQITESYNGKELIAVSSFAKTKAIDAFEK